MQTIKKKIQTLGKLKDVTIESIERQVGDGAVKA